VTGLCYRLSVSHMAPTSSCEQRFQRGHVESGWPRASDSLLDRVGLEKNLRARLCVQRVEKDGC
jgi:hypothetical protein